MLIYTRLVMAMVILMTSLIIILGSLTFLNRPDLSVLVGVLMNGALAYIAYRNFQDASKCVQLMNP